MDQRSRAKKPAELPQWNSKFRYSAQKPAGGAEAKDAGGQDRASKQDNHAGNRTPLGQPRRVPVAGQVAAGVHQGAKEQQQQQQPQGPAAAAGSIGLDADKTPTACLFQRFESLTLATPAPSTQREQPLLTAANAATAPQRRSVAFGTPSVLSYTPAAGGPAPLDSTPLWSNAGHTPFSLSSSEAGCGIRTLCIDKDEGPAAAGGGEDSAAVSAELFTSIITDTGHQHTPVATVACPRSPAELLPPAADVAAASQQPARQISSASSFKGFATGLRTADASSCGTPPAFSKSRGISTGGASGAAGADLGNACPATPAATPARAAAGHVVPAAAAVTPAAKEWLELVSAGAVGSSHVPMPTPKSKLKQPERVKSTKPAIPTELKQLLSDPAAAAAAQPCEEVLLGSCDVLSPVRACKQLQSSMGAGDQVLTPVRRSARKVKDALAGPSGRLQPMLEATNYCYAPNSAIPGLDRVQTGGGGHS